MSTKIIPKKSTVASKVPLAGDLEIGEIALNLTDKKLYSKDGNSNIVEIGGGGLTASEILTAIKTVDGAASGLDADLLDGKHASAFATAAQGALSDTAVQPNDTPTFAGLSTTADVTFGDGDKAIFGAGSDLQIYHDGSDSYVTDAGAGNLLLQGSASVRIRSDDGLTTSATFVPTSFVRLNYAGIAKLETTSTGVDVTGTVNATAFTGDGSGLTGIAAGATGGGSDAIFWENNQTVTTNYTITDGKNAMSAGPITINSGVTVTVGAGETWTVV